jgi:hypothetical protein
LSTSGKALPHTLSEEVKKSKIKSDAMKFKYTRYKKDSNEYVSVEFETDIAKLIPSGIFGLTLQNDFMK